LVLVLVLVLVALESEYCQTRISTIAVATFLVVVVECGCEPGALLELIHGYSTWPDKKEEKRLEAVMNLPDAVNKRPYAL